MTHPLDLHPLKDAACEAWNIVKQPQQPEYSDLPMAYKSQLLDHATHAKSGEPLPEDDSPFSQFERAVAGETPEPEIEVPVQIADTVEVEPIEDDANEDDAKVEEVEKQEPKGPLPDDFPAHDKLHAAGVNTYGQLAKVEDVTFIDGIGVETAKAIAKRVKAETRKLNNTQKGE